MNSSDETDATASDSDDDDHQLATGQASAPMETDTSVDGAKEETNTDDAVSALLNAASADVATEEMMGSSETASEGPSEHAPKDEDTNGGTSKDSSALDGMARAEVTTVTAADDLRDERPEQHYSTRGRDRHKDEDVRIAPDDQADKELSPAVATHSFLEDLTGHERLTRTRFLPHVDGIHALRKSEVRLDLTLARAIVTSLGVAGQVPSKRSRKTRPVSNQGRDDSPMDLDDDGGAAGPSDDDMEDASAHSTKLEMSMAATSKVFLAPPDVNTGDDIDGNGKKNQPTRPPHVVEAVTAYNPPRPPESVGPKKKHRMLRWERKPQDVEIDLSNYRKTVQRTREELQNAEHERERIESIGFALQNSYLSQLRALNEEGRELNQELGRIQQNCIKSADLLTSRTRSRGGGKGSHVMKDVLAILKARGSEMADIGIAIDTIVPTAEVKIPPGIGGVSAQSLMDWNQSTVFAPVDIASAWILPGDAVHTPYGEGTVIHVYGPCELDASTAPLSAAIPKPTLPLPIVPISKPTSFRQAIVGEAKPDSTHGFGTPSGKIASLVERNIAAKTSLGGVLSGGKTGNIQGEDKDATWKTVPSGMAINTKNGGKKPPFSDGHRKGEPQKENVLSPRICVELPFGIGFFSASVVTSKEDPSSYSDSKLAARWKSMIETALPVGSCLDVAGMETIGFVRPKDKPMVTNEEGMDVEDEVEGSQSGEAAAPGYQNGESNNSAASKRFVPFGSGILPTSIGRGGIVAETEISAIESALKKPIFEGHGVLGMRENQGLPRGFREWEDAKCELSVLRATLLQRRNELNRQRRIRHLNMRALTTTNDRSLRVEALVHEMRADLKSLKDRLDDELVELRISSELAEGLLSSFYRAQDKSNFCITDATPPKRRRTGKDGSDSVSPARRVPVDAAATGAEVNTEEDDDDEQLEAVPVGTSLIQAIDDGDKDRPNKRSRPSAQ